MTTHRIAYEYKEWGSSYYQSIMLEDITSCENSYSSQIWLLILGGLSAVGGLIAATNNNTESFGAGMLIALVFAALYWFTRRNVIIIGSPSTKMLVSVKGMQSDRILEFINKIELAKHNKSLTYQ